MSNIPVISTEPIINSTPDSISGGANNGDWTVRAFSTAVDKHFFQMWSDMQVLVTLPQIATMPENVVDALAVMRNVDFYDPTLPLAQKRFLLQMNFQWKLRIGTPSVIEEIVSQVFSYAVVQEFWEYGGSAFHFQILIDDTSFSPTMLGKLFTAVHKYKPVHAFFDGVVKLTNIGANGINTVHYGMAIATNSRQQINISRRPS